jgi:uncharacterized protein YggT (Ycf19 family)
MLVLLFWLGGRSFASAPGIAAGVLFTLAAMELARASLYLLIGVVIVQVIISWVNPHAPLAPVFDALTRPFYALFRRFVPPIGNVDLSPLFVLLVAQILLILFDNFAQMMHAPSSAAQAPSPGQKGISADREPPVRHSGAPERSAALAIRRTRPGPRHTLAPGYRQFCESILPTGER